MCFGVRKGVGVVCVERGERFFSEMNQQYKLQNPSVPFDMFVIYEIFFECDFECVTSRTKYFRAFPSFSGRFVMLHSF